jgi:hypothetical protein
VKRIPIRVWALRDEIEAALERRIKECEAAGTPLFLDDIKEFYGMKVDKPLSGQPQLQLVNNEVAAAQDGVDDLMASLSQEKPAEEEAPKVETSEATEVAPPVAEKADEVLAAQTPAEKVEAHDAPHVQRPYERLAPDSTKVSYGFALLADLNMDWMLTFSKEKYVQGQSVVVEFLIPRPFMMSAEIVLCHHYGMRSRIISETRPDFRLQCQFTYKFAGERTRLREFLQSVEPTLPKKSATPKPAQDEAGP